MPSYPSITQLTTSPSPLDDVFRATLLRLAYHLNLYEGHIPHGAFRSLTVLSRLAWSNTSQSTSLGRAKICSNSANALRSLVTIATSPKQRLDDHHCFHLSHDYGGQFEGHITYRKKIISIIVAGTAIVAEVQSEYERQWNAEHVKREARDPEQESAAETDENAVANAGREEAKASFKHLAIDLERLRKWRLTSGKAAARRNSEAWPDSTDRFLTQATTAFRDFTIQPAAIDPRAEDSRLLVLARSCIEDRLKGFEFLRNDVLMTSLAVDVQTLMDLSRSVLTHPVHWPLSNTVMALQREEWDDDELEYTLPR